MTKREEPLPIAVSVIGAPGMVPHYQRVCYQINIEHRRYGSHSCGLGRKGHESWELANPGKNRTLDVLRVGEG